jgi:hypothetical protein
MASDCECPCEHVYEEYISFVAQTVMMIFNMTIRLMIRSSSSRCPGILFFGLVRLWKHVWEFTVLIGQLLDESGWYRSDDCTEPLLVSVLQYSNMSLLKEWQSEVDRSGPALRNEKGYFTCSIEVPYEGLLTQSLSTTTTTDGAFCHQVQYDNSDYLYIGRSFGVGALVGLVDDTILQADLARRHRYQETGYATSVSNLQLQHK